LAKLQSLHVRDLKRPQIPPDHLPTFDEALVAIKGRINMYLDFKQGDRAAVAQMIRSAGVTKQILVYDDTDSVAEWRRVAPELPLIVSPPQSAKTPEQLANFASKLGIEVLDDSWEGFSRQMLEAAKKVGVQVWPDIQDGQENAQYFNKVMEVGFTGVQTDHPEELIAWLTQHHRR
jgi:glycerophosphoryl diester phosphodiesterase